MAKKSKTYDISCTTYIKEPAGTKDKYGRNKFNVVSKTDTMCKNTTYKQLKHDTYNKVKKNNENPKNPKMYANYEDVFTVKKSRRLKSVTKKFANGTVQIIYFGKRCKSC